MKKINKMIFMGAMCLIANGCSSDKMEFYNDKKPKIDLRTFFDGNIEGWGSIFDSSGRQTRSFYVTLKGTWNKNNGILEEWFVFDDGEKTERKWEIVFSDDKSFVGTAKDIVGPAVGKQNGNAVNLNYVLTVPYKDSTINLNMDDWMYLIQDDIILNRTSMKKFGFKVGDLVLFMKKKQ